MTSASPWYRRPSLTWLLAAMPVAIVLEVLHAPAVAIFLVAGLAIIPLAGLMGRATENLAETLGPGIGGLLNATFGNAAELIIALMVLWKGPAFYELVKASITGSIIGNILLVLGLSILVGGLRHTQQRFNATAASVGTTLLGLACVGLIVPTLFYYLPVTADGSRLPNRELEHLSEEIALILAIVYGLSLLFSLRTHKHLYGETETLPSIGEHHEPEWSRCTSVIVLVLATLGVALMSEFLVGSVEQTAEKLGLNAVFIGVIVVAVIGNAAEHSTAVLVAWKNKMDLSLAIAVGSSIQIALFVAPVLVFASVLMGHERALDLHFTPLETVALLLSVGILALVANDGESNWLEGAMLLAVYVIFGLAFFHLPVQPHG